MSIFFDRIFYDIHVTAFIFFAPRLAFLGSFLIVIFHLALTASVDYVVALIYCFCHILLE